MRRGLAGRAANWGLVPTITVAILGAAGSEISRRDKVFVPISRTQT